MPRSPWTGYGRFCPLARSLDVVGERWALVIVQELIKRPSRYSELSRRLPGIGTTVLAERLRKLQATGLVERRPGAVGEGVDYALTERGLALAPALAALRRWGVEFLTDPSADGAQSHEFDVRYVDGIDILDAGEFGMVIDGAPTTLRFRDGHLTQTLGDAHAPEVVVTTTSAFMTRWAAGELTWDDGLDSGEVTHTGTAASWNRWLAATGYPARYEPIAPS
jgi:DNA-binding HxlR family transcriptional regulator